MDVANGEVATFDGVADREVVGGDDRVTFGPEVAGPPVERGEIGGHDRGGHHGDDERGGPERERARRAAEHGESFPRAARGRVEHEPGKEAGERCGGLLRRRGRRRGLLGARRRLRVGRFFVLSLDDESTSCRFESDFVGRVRLLRLLGLLGLRSRRTSPDPSVRERLPPFRLSVRWKPEPLKTMPTGWNTLASLPPQPGCFFRGSSENDCHSSISSPHFAHS